MMAKTACTISLFLATSSFAHAEIKSERFEVPLGAEAYVGDMPIFGEACFKVLSKDTSVEARGHFRGLINGKPIDLDRHMGGRCLKFVRDTGCCLYRVYVIADEGQALVVIRTVDEKPHDWNPGRERIRKRTQSKQ